MEKETHIDAQLILDENGNASQVVLPIEYFMMPQQDQVEALIMINDWVHDAIKKNAH